MVWTPICRLCINRVSAACAFMFELWGRIGGALAAARDDGVRVEFAFANNGIGLASELFSMQVRRNICYVRRHGRKLLIVCKWHSQPESWSPPEWLSWWFWIDSFQSKTKLSFALLPFSCIQRVLWFLVYLWVLKKDQTAFWKDHLWERLSRSRPQ